MKKIKLGEVLDVTRGASLPGEYYSSNGSLIRLTLGNFNYPGGGFQKNTVKENLYFTGNVRSEFIMKKGDIITPFTEQVKGLLGETARIPEDNKYIQSGDIGKVIPDEKLLDNGFAYYLVSSPYVKKQLSASSQQTKIRHTSPDGIKDCYAYIPSMDYQKKSAKLLNMIDRKINVGYEELECIDSSVNTIYERWFAQFDFPNEKNKPYAENGGEFDFDSKYKMSIPKGWHIENLLSNCLSKPICVGVEKFDKKIYLPTSNVEGTMFYDGNEISYETRETRANMQPTENSVWFAKMKNSVKHITITNKDDWFVNGYILSTGFYGIQCDELSLPYIHSFIYSNTFEKIKNRYAHGATQESVNNDDIGDIPLIIPDDNTLKKFNNVVYKMLIRRMIILKEIYEMKKIKDYLIPFFMTESINFKETI